MKILFTHKLISFFALIVMLLLGYFFVYQPINDYFKVQRVKEIVTWLETYYSGHDYYYPSMGEFSAKFPDFAGSYYTGIDNTSDGRLADSFTFKYYLSSRRSFGFGNNTYEMFTDGVYYVGPCQREFTAHNSISSFTSDGGANILADYDAGIIYLITWSGSYSEKTANKTTIITGLDHPRLLAKGDGNMYITNGSDLYSYQINKIGNILQLVNPQKVDIVQDACPDGYPN